MNTVNLVREFTLVMCVYLGLDRAIFGTFLRKKKLSNVERENLLSCVLQ